MELLEADFAQIEHINQILYNSSGYEGWMCFDTHHLIQAYNEILQIQYPSNTSQQNSNKIGTYDENNPSNSRITKEIKDVRYDSFIVSCEKVTNGWKYTFEIRNALWDGTYKVTKSKNNYNDDDIYFNKGKVVVSRSDANANTVVFTITDTDSDKVRICFHLALNGKGRSIQTTSLIIDNPSEYTHQYDETVCEIGYIKLDDGTPVEGAEVSIEPVNSSGLPISDGIDARTVTTDKNGMFKMCYSKVNSPGDYYVLMKVTYNGISATKLIHIRKVQEQTLFLDWGDAEQYNNIKKGSVKTFNIILHVNNEYGLHDTSLDEKLKDLSFNVSLTKIGGKTDNVQTCKVTEKDGVYSINPTISFRDYYEDSSRLVVDVPLSTGFGNRTEEHLLRHIWFVAEDYDDIVREVDDVYGADWIFLDAKTYTRTKVINITRTLTIAGLTGDVPCTINGNNQNIITINSPNPATDNYMEVNILGLKLMNGQGAIQSSKGCRLLVDHCYFTDNKNASKNHTGCSVYMPITDETKKTNNLWKTEIRYCRFHNNRGNEIQSIGKTYIHNNLFTTTDKNQLKQPEVKVVSVRAGEVTYKENKSYINIPFTNKSDAIPLNHSYAKALCYVDSGAKFNGKGPASLKANNTLPLYEAPYKNEAYTRCCYYYPYSNVRTYIVCSPEKGKERRATGHASSSKNWVFYDGYYFTRLENSKGNTYNPWTEEELKLPENTGIYNITSNKFLQGYDPRFSNSQSKNTTI